MIRIISSALVGLLFLATTLAAQDIGSASGQGTIDRFTWAKGATVPTVEKVPFSPRYSYAYTQGTGPARMTWIVLTEKQPPLASWAAAKDQAETRRLWSEKEKASFVAVELNAQWGVELYFLCPGNGKVNTEMVSTANGLDSVVVKLISHDAKRVKGALQGGDGACGDPEVYCTKKSDYLFDAPMVAVPQPPAPAHH